MRVNQRQTPKAEFAKQWRADEEALLARLWPDHSVNEIAPMLPGYTLAAIRCKATRMGLKKDFDAKRARRMTPTRKKAMVFHPDFTKYPDRAVIAYEPDGVREFKNAKEAAAYYGLSVQRVYNLIATAEATYSEIGFDYLAL